VKRLAAALGPSARVGTVDKFQGQEAPVVIISLATSSFDGSFASDAPALWSSADDHGDDAVVVLSEDLAASRAATSLDQMRALSFACRLLEGGHSP
jgi:uncharacterized protein